MTQPQKNLELTFKNSEGHIHKSSVAYFLDDLDPIIFAEQLEGIPMLDTHNHQLNSRRLRRSRCVKADRIDVIKNKLFDTKQ